MGRRQLSQAVWFVAAAVPIAMVTVLLLSVTGNLDSRLALADIVGLLLLGLLAQLIARFWKHGP